MKKLLLILGMLVVPSVAHGQAFSPWVQEVLNRADAGISLADGLPAGSCDDETVQSQIHNNQSFIRQLVLPSLEREEQSQSLRERTVCVENDRRLIQIKIRAVQDAMDQAVLSCKGASSVMLRENYAFLFKAYMTFMKGASDPSVQDDLLRYNYAFHDRALFDAGTNEPVPIPDSTLPLCPYTTDYGVHSIAELPGSQGEIRSFGCDLEMLPNISLSHLDQEAGDLKDFMEKTQTLATDLYDTVSRALFNIDTVISILSGTPPPQGTPGAKPPPPHAELSGCLKPEAPDLTSDDPLTIESVLSAYPDYFETYNIRDDGAGPTYSPPPEQTLPKGMLHLPVIDYFLVQMNAGVAARSYSDKRQFFGQNRPLPTHLVTQMFDNILEKLFRGSDAAASLVTVDGNIERESAIFDMGSRDAMQRKQDAAIPLEEAVNSLIDVTEEFLPKEYTPQLTYFLARSCVDGYCQRTLDAVAQRTFNPYCHPYVSGLYREEDAAKKCFCDREIETKDPGFWKQYCSPNFNEDRAKYDAMEPKLIPACVEESASRSAP